MKSQVSPFRPLYFDHDFLNRRIIWIVRVTVSEITLQLEVAVKNQNLKVRKILFHYKFDSNFFLILLLILCLCPLDISSLYCNH